MRTFELTIVVLKNLIEDLLASSKEKEKENSNLMDLIDNVIMV